MKTFLIIFFLAIASFSFAADEDEAATEAGSKAEKSVRTPADDSDYVIEKRGGKKIKYKKKTKYDFDGANIDGLYNKPSGSYISNIKDVKAKSIIRIRENFDPEVVDSARQVK